MAPLYLGMCVFVVAGAAASLQRVCQDSPRSNAPGEAFCSPGPTGARIAY